MNQFLGPRPSFPYLEIENIEDMRRREGIDDVELREGIGGLKSGDLVKLTLLTGRDGCAGETVVVRVTGIRGHALRGKLVSKPASPGLSALRAGSPVAFTTAHIHSLPKVASPPKVRRQYQPGGKLVQEKACRYGCASTTANTSVPPCGG